MPDPGAPPLFTRPMAIVMATLLLGAMMPNIFLLASRYLGERGLDEQAIGLVTAAFQLAALIVIPSVGPLSARFGHGRVIAGGCAVSTAGAALFVIADGAAGFAIARGVQGAGFGVVLVGAGSYVAEIAPLPRLGEALGMSGVLTLAAQAIGPALGEAIRPAGWSAVFLSAIGFGVLASLVALTLPPARVDPGAAGAGDGPPVSGVPILAATLLAGAGFGAIWAFLADYSAQVGIDNTTWFFTPYVIAAIATRLFLGRLSDRVGRREVAIPALAGHALVVLPMTWLDAPWMMVVIGLGYGLCHGLYYPVLQAMLVERGRGRRGRAITASTLAFGGGGILASVGLGALARAHGYASIFPVAAAAGALACLLVVLDRGSARAA